MRLFRDGDRFERGELLRYFGVYVVTALVTRLILEAVGVDDDAALPRMALVVVPIAIGFWVAGQDRLRRGRRLAPPARSGRAR